MNTIVALSQVVIKELYRRKDFYVLFVLTALITGLMAFANLFHDNSIVRYIREICLLLIWVSALVIAVTTTSRQIPAERENRTIFPLLAKPVTRAQVVAGKFLGCWLASGLALVVFYLFLMVVSASKDHEWLALHYLQAVWLHWVFLAVVIALVLLGSVVFAAPSSTNTISLVAVFGILLLGRYLSLIAVRQAEPVRFLLEAIYFLIPHLEWFNISAMVVHQQPLIPWRYLGGATLYGAAYTAFFLFGTWCCFRKKALN